MQAKGYLFAFLTIVIWSGWMIMTRLAAINGLSVYDLAFLRFTGAAFIVLPIAIKNRHLITRKNFPGIFIMSLGAGALYFILMAIGFKYAPAGHGILTPCVMTMLVAIGSYIFFKEKFGLLRLLGYAFIIIGVLYKIFVVSQGQELIADIFFLGGSLCWATYTLLHKKHGLPPLAAMSFVQIGSILLFAPIYFVYQYNEPHYLPVMDSLFQLIYQAAITGVLSLIFYNKAISYIGPSRTSSFGALLPVMVTLIAIPLLGEYPTNSDLIFVAFMSAGVLLASGIAGKLRQKSKITAK